VLDFQRLWVPGAIPNLNDLLAARGSLIRLPNGKRLPRYGELKERWEQRIVLFARVQRLEPVQAACFTYVFFEESRRRDPGNTVAAGLKLFEDALQKARILSGDGWKQVLGYAFYWSVDKRNPGTQVFMHPDSVLSREHALSYARERNM
jgi:hypothetical protein